MNHHKEHFIKYVLLLILFLAVCGLSGCGSGGGGGNESGAKGNSAIIAGQATKGPISGGVVTAYAVSNGARGAALNTAITDSSGNYTLSIKDYNGPVFLEITGGSYADETTGKTINVPVNAGSGLQAVVANVTAGSTVQCQITPLTTMAAALAQNMPGELTASNINAANQQIGAYFDGIDIINTSPINPLLPGSASGASESAVNYGLILAGLSQQAETSGLSNPFDLFTAMAQDISDGIFDGKSGTDRVKINEYPVDPTMGNSLLASAINTFSRSTHNVSGNTVSNALIRRLQKTWVKTYGSAGSEWPVNIQQTPDGGYIMAGYTDSYSVNADIWIIKLDGAGDIQWQKTYGGEDWESVSYIQHVSDGGFILVGSTYSNGSNSHALVMKLDADGKIEWKNTYDGEWEEWFSSIQETEEGGYIVIGSTTDPVTYDTFTWIMKLSANGSVDWETIYGGTVHEWPAFIHQTSEGGYIATGATSSPGDGSSDISIVKLNENGQVLWQKTYGDADYEMPSAIRQTVGGGYIVAGITYGTGDGHDNGWIMKLASDGTVEWHDEYIAEDMDGASSIHLTSDGGYVAAGTASSDADGSGDAWVIKLDNNGNVQWQKAYGGKGYDEAASIEQTSDGGYILAGYTNSIGKGKEDIWLLKLDSDGNVYGCMDGLNLPGASSIESVDSPGISINIDPVFDQTPYSSVNLATISEDAVSSEPVSWCSGGPGDAGPAYTLTITEAAYGTVTSSPGGINCGTDCIHTFPDETEVTLTAVPSFGSFLSGWSGDADCSDGQLTMDSDKSCSPTFGGGPDVIDNAGDVGVGVSIALDHDNKVHVSYYDVTNSTIKYANNNVSGTWVTEVVDDIPYDESSLSKTIILLDSKNGVHIGYYIYGEGVRYATNTSGSWAPSTLISGNDVTFSMIIDQNDKLHISYTADGKGLFYMTNASGSWVSSPVDTSSVQETGTELLAVGDIHGTAIAIDKDQKLHVLYQFIEFTGAGDNTYLRYAVNTSGSWSPPVDVDSGGSYYGLGIAVDSNGSVHAAYGDSPADFDLKYITNAAGDWMISSVGSMWDDTSDTNIVVDSNDKIHICAIGGCYITNSSGEWITDPIYGAQSYIAMALDTNNRAHMAYHTDLSGIGNLMYVTNSNL